MPQKVATKLNIGIPYSLIDKSTKYDSGQVISPTKFGWFKILRESHANKYKNAYRKWWDKTKLSVDNCYDNYTPRRPCAHSCGWSGSHLGRALPVPQPVCGGRCPPLGLRLCNFLVPATSGSFRCNPQSISADPVHSFCRPHTLASPAFRESQRHGLR